MMVSAFDYLEDRLLSKSDIKKVIDILLCNGDGTILPYPNLELEKLNLLQYIVQSLIRSVHG